MKRLIQKLLRDLALIPATAILVYALVMNLPYQRDSDSKTQAIQSVEVQLKADLGQVDAVIYSLASPRRTNPRTGVTHKSCLKPRTTPPIL